MIKKLVTYFSFFAFVALFGIALHAERSAISLCEAGDVASGSSLVESDSDVDVAKQLSSILLSADESAVANGYSLRALRPFLPFEQNSHPSYLRTVVGNYHSFVWRLRNHLQLELQKHISACHYASGYYIYELRRLLI